MFLKLDDRKNTLINTRDIYSIQICDITSFIIFFNKGYNIKGYNINVCYTDSKMMKSNYDNLWNMLYEGYRHE